MNERFRLHRLSMRYRIIFVFFILIIVPFLLVGYIALSKSETTIRNTNTDAIVLTGKNLNSYFHYVQNEQDKLMASDEMQQLMSGDIWRHKDEIAFTNQLLTYVDNMNYANRLFKISILPLNPLETPVYMQSVYGQTRIDKEGWFQQIVSEGRSFWKLFGPADSPGIVLEPTLSSIKRLHSLRTFEPLGIVMMDIRPSVLADFIYPMKQFPNQKIMLLTKNNEIVYTTDGHYGKSAIEAGLANALERQELSGTLQYGGQEALVNIAPLLQGELNLVSVTPVKDLENPVSVLNRINYTFLLFYALLSIFLAGYITVKYTNPISSLTKEMKAIARSGFKETSFSESPHAFRRDEIGWLYRGIDNMIREIGNLIAETKANEKRKKQLEFEVLNYQINPHFLYNSLDTIRWKAEARQAGEIAGLASSLATLFRLSLNRGKEMTTAGRELELLKSYLSIERARQDKPIRVSFRVEDEILALPLLRLILQPLVENAIRHGIADMGEDGMIVVQGHLEEGKLVFRVTDNGAGIPEESLATLLDAHAAAARSKEGGLGLVNVHERLRHYFGEPYGLAIESEPGKGTTVVIVHPDLSAAGPDNGED